MGAVILIDGPHLLGTLRSIKAGVDWRRLAQTLLARYAPVNLAVFYGGLPGQESVLEAMIEAGYQVRGRQPKRTGTAALANDLDIQIAVDMVQMADSADRIALVSGDNGFSYSVRLVVNRGIPVDILALTPVVGHQLIHAGGTPVDLMSVLANLTSENIEADNSAQESALWALKGLSRKNRKDLRALWYGVLLERTLRQLCEVNGIVTSPNDGIDGLNGKLMKVGAYPKLTHKKITVYAHIRNSAAHGQFDNYSDRDVEDMAKWVGNFPADHA